MQYNETPEEIMRDLYEVGIHKALGYLPTKTIINICGKSIQEIIDFAEANGLRHWLYQTECVSELYVYDVSMLSQMINNYTKS
ncbi:hypothetical protein [Paenibacillus oleatilyticus]|uniref:hypothetical protein n=1 Tax=Paenibacillus oleatilyticus TaxID=2594886 RepID=UPI001C1FF218|nr:hypothetical protein [Paenibacillus oleatilyticus]MBU7316091.1 hypothetical protein [Paenibacillus oleatilyticus]